MAAVTSAATAAVARIGATLSDAQYFESSMVRPEEIRRQLDSRSVKDKLDAMKRVIALISLGKDASMFFPDVVKNVVAPSLDVKKLVYLYLVHYAEHKQDLALLAVNSFQKDLSDPNQHIRALSLRVLSSIRVKVILQVVILAINNASKDPSPYVRKVAAHAISKVCALDLASKDLLLDPLHTLLNDQSPQVLGSAVATYDDVSPYQWSMIHPQFRRICNNLSVIEPWGQVPIVHMLIRYARTHFANPYPSPSSEYNPSARNSDLSLLISTVTPLLHSLNNSVVASTIPIFFHLASPDEFAQSAIKPLMRLVAACHQATQAVALHIASAVATRHPHLLIPYLSEFYVSPALPAPLRNLRIRVLTTICAAAGRPRGLGSKPEARRTLLAELRDYLFRPDKHLAASAAKAIGALAAAHPDSTPAIVNVLSSVVASADNHVVVAESIAVLRRLLQRHPPAQSKALPQLIAMLLTSDDTRAAAIRDPAARSSIIWLIAEFYDKVQAIATEALRLLAKGFVHEASEVKVQILNLAAKIVVCNDAQKGLVDFQPSTSDIRFRLMEYVVSCARYDRDYDVRDKARMMHSIFIANADSSVLNAARAAFLSRKPIPDGKSSVDNTDDFLDTKLDADVIVGSLAHVMAGRRLPGFRPLEPWIDVDSDSVLRESESENTNMTSDLRHSAMGSCSSAVQSTSMTSSTMAWISSQIGGSSNTTQTPSMAQGISSDTIKNINGGLASSGAFGGAAGGGMRYSPGVAMQSRTGGIGSTAYVNMDPSKFYENNESENDDGNNNSKSGDEEEDEEEDDDDEDDDDDDDEDDDADEDEDEDEDEAGHVITGGADVNLLGLPTLGETSTTDLLSSSVAKPTLMERRDVPRKAPKPTSEYDLDALLGNMSIPEGSSGDQLLSRGIESTDSMMGSTWSRVVQSWNAGGLEVDARFLRSIPGTAGDVSPVVLRVTNRGKTKIEAISFASKCEEGFVCLQKIASLGRNATEDVKVEARFRGKTSGVRFEVVVGEEVVGEGEFKPSIGYVLRPRPEITPIALAEAEKSLTGMFASEATVAMNAPKQNDWMKLSSDVKDKMSEACFLSHNKTSVGGQGMNSTERFSMVFVGYLPSSSMGTTEQRPVVLRITVNSGASGSGCSCVVWIGCEDVLFSANLMRMCRSVLASID